MALLSLVLITVYYRSGGTALAPLRRVATAVFAPVQEGVSTVLRPVGNFFRGVGDLFSARAQLPDLRATINELQAEQRALQDLVRENASLRELLAMRDRDQIEGIPAEVTGVSPSSFEWTVTLDVGTSDGVAEDMVVVNGQGLVGRIVSVTPFASRVLLAIDSSFGAASRVARNGEQAIVFGGGRDPMQLQLIDTDADANPGDEVVTSSYEGGTFPDGLRIGVIEQVEPAGKVDRRGRVRPYVDFTRLDFVLVVVRGPNRPPPPPPEAGPSPTATPTLSQTPGATPPSPATPGAPAVPVTPSPAPS